MTQDTSHYQSIGAHVKALRGLAHTSLLAKVCVASGVMFFFASCGVLLGCIYEGAEFVSLAFDISSFDILTSVFFIWLLVISGYFAKHRLWLLNLVPDYVLRKLSAQPKPFFIVPSVISPVPNAHGSRAPPTSF